MKRLLSAHGADIYRHVPGCSEDIDLQVGRRDIDQTPRAQLVVRECLAIHAQGEIVIHAARQVTPVSRRKRFVRQWFKIHHAQCVFGVCDGGHGILCESVRRQRTRRHETQELTTMKRLHVHGEGIYHI